MKTDDDMINNIWKIGSLVDALKSQKEGMNMITCSTKTERVIRQKTGTRIDKWVRRQLIGEMDRVFIHPL